MINSYTYSIEDASSPGYKPKIEVLGRNLFGDGGRDHVIGDRDNGFANTLEIHVYDPKFMGMAQVIAYRIQQKISTEGFQRNSTRVTNYQDYAE